MKGFLFFIIFIPFVIFSQSTPSNTGAQPQSLEELQREIVYMKSCFKSYQKQRRIGAGLWGTAIGSSIIIAAINTNDRAVILFPAMFALVGSIVLIDSHKWIGRAGNFKVTSTGISVTIR